MCQVLGVSRSGYYDWSRHSRDSLSHRVKANQQLLEAIRTVYERSRGTYGSPRITVELRTQGIHCGRHRVARLMRNSRIVAKTKRRFKITTNCRHRHPVGADIVNRCFVAQSPNRLWVSDITYLWTRQGWIYLAVILDVFSRFIVGWAISTRLRKELVMSAFHQAVDRREVLPGLIFHSDRGSQYASTEFQQLLQQYSLRASMSATGSCYDNAITESFFHTLKTELIYFNRYQTREEASLSIFDYIEIFYNRQRRHSALGHLSPFEFERQHALS